MVEATHQPKDHFCLACYNGDYPVAYDADVDKEIIERRSVESVSFGELLDKGFAVKAHLRLFRSKNVFSLPLWHPCFVLETTLFGNKKWSSQVQI